MSVLEALRSIFDIFAGHAASPLLLHPLLLNVVTIYEAVENSIVQVSPDVHIALENTISSALRSFGLPAFLKVKIIFSYNNTPMDVE